MLDSPLVFTCMLAELSLKRAMSSEKSKSPSVLLLSHAMPVMYPSTLCLRMKSMAMPNNAVRD